MIEKSIEEEIKMSDKIETFEAIVEAVEKQIPYKPTPHYGAWRCKCGKLFLSCGTKYCGKCWQRLDWS